MTGEQKPPENLTHFDEQGRARMVDVGQKAVTQRFARASCVVRMQAKTVEKVKAGEMAKGDVIQVARLAGIQAAKRTWELIPLCHQLPLDSVELDFDFPDSSSIGVSASVRVTAKTGAEMEALTAANIAALTIYDMCKAIDREIEIHQVQLDEKRGGKSGDFLRGQR